MSSLSDPHRPNWQSVRARSAYGFDALAQLSRLCPGRLQESAVFLVIARICLPDWINEDGCLGIPANSTKFVTAHAVSVSLNRPFETVRRHVSWLADQNLIYIDNRRISLSLGSRAKDIIEFFQSRHECLLQFTKRLIEADDMASLSDRFDSMRFPFVSTLTAAIDLDLVPFEINPSLHENLERTAIYAGFAYLGTQHIMNNPVLSAKYRHINTPDEGRVAVSIRKVASLVGVSYSTAYRQTNYLASVGLLSKTESRLFVVKSNDLLQNELNEASVKYFTYLRKKMRDLIRYGSVAELQV